VDLGDRESALCLLDREGEIRGREVVKMTPEALGRYFSALERGRVVIEAGTHSPWVSRLLSDLGYEVIVANPTELYGGKRRRRKSDRLDAEFLARQGRVDPALLSPIRHRGEEAQAALAVVGARDVLVRSRTQLINHVRGVVKAVGARLPKCSAESFARTTQQHLPVVLAPALLPLLETISRLTAEIGAYDKKIVSLSAESYPETERLRQVAGVGALTALTFVLVLEECERFPSSRAVGSYLGLVPRLEETGGVGKGAELRITKAGHELLRRLLVSAAQYILGPFGPDTDLRRWGLMLAGRGGKNAKKRAVVAVARKLSVLLLTLWKSGERYEPLRCSDEAIEALRGVLDPKQNGSQERQGALAATAV
jgi:transposase